MNYLRILLAIVVIALGYGGYVWFMNKRAAEKEAVYMKYAGVIAEVSIAAELYRDDNQAFLDARDSIFKMYKINADSFAAFRAELDGKPDEWVDVWNKVDSLTASMVAGRIEKPDSTADSLLSQ